MELVKRQPTRKKNTVCCPPVASARMTLYVTPCVYVALQGAFGAAQATRDLSRYPTALNFYKVPPTDEVTLDEFEALAVTRLKGAASRV